VKVSVFLEVEGAARHAVPTTLLLPGIGTLHDLRRAHRLGVRSMRIATHCTEADISAQHIAAARALGMDVAGFLMMSHLAHAPDFLRLGLMLALERRPAEPRGRTVLDLVAMFELHARLVHDAAMRMAAKPSR
jgi:hypothetical protein